MLNLNITGDMDRHSGVAVSVLQPDNGYANDSKRMNIAAPWGICTYRWQGVIASVAVAAAALGSVADNTRSY